MFYGLMAVFLIRRLMLTTNTRLVLFKHAKSMVIQMPNGRQTRMIVYLLEHTSFFVDGSLVSWCSKKHQFVATSSMESEYMSASAASKVINPSF